MTALQRTGIWQKLLAANSNNNTAPTRNAVITQPTTEGIVTFAGLNLKDALFRVAPFGTDAANETGTIYVYRWQVLSNGLAGSASLVNNYFATLAGVFTFALCARTGIADGIVADTQFFADTIAQTASTGDASGIVISTGADYVSEIRIPITPGTWGMEVVTVTGGSSATLNALVMVA